MFCPRCGCEYREGITECADCRVALVQQPPEPEEPSDSAPDNAGVAYKEVLATYNPGDIAFIKSILDGEGITYFFKGENFMLMRPLVEPARLMVRADQAEQVMEILKDLKLAYLSMTFPEDEE